MECINRVNADGVECIDRVNADVECIYRVNADVECIDRVNADGVESMRMWSALTVSMRMWSALTVSMRMWSAFTVSMRMWSAFTVSMRMVWGALTVSMRIGVFVWSAVSMTLLALTWSMHSKVRWLFIFGVLLLAGYVEAADLYVPEGQGVSTESKPKIDFARLSVPFIENKGQISNEDVLYYASCFFGNVWVTNDGNITYSLPSGTVSGVSIREIFPDRLNPRIEAKDQAETKINYFIGASDNWKTNIPAYNEVSLGEVYPGINLSLKAYGNNVEKLFTLLPGALPERIKVRLDGCSFLSINKDGCLEIATEIGSIKMTRPIAYQDTTKGRDYIDVAYRIEGNTYGFTIGEYNQDLPLIIDPLLAST